MQEPQSYVAPTHFSDDNTVGFTQAELNWMNREMEALQLDAHESSDEYKRACEEILKLAESLGMGDNS